MAGREAEIITRTDRALAKAAAGGGKSVTAITSSFMKGSMAAPAPKEKKMQKILVSRCRRLAGQATVVGTTVISYNKDGICHLPDHANASVDFEAHCRQNGVERLADIMVGMGDEEAAPAAPPASPVVAPEDIAPPGAELPPPAPEPEPLPEPPAPAPEPEPELDPVPVDEDPAPAEPVHASDDAHKKSSKKSTRR